VPGSRAGGEALPQCSCAGKPSASADILPLGDRVHKKHL